MIFPRWLARLFLLNALAAAFFFAGNASAQPPEETDKRFLPTAAERAAISAVVGQFMQKYKVEAVSLAVARHGHFVYREAFGLADVATGEKATPESLFRIASISKPLTSAGIFTLIEQGRLKLSDHVFGAEARGDRETIAERLHRPLDGLHASTGIARGYRRYQAT